MSPALDNYSKKISKTDDSAGKLLMELLGEDPGRNFDVESIFAFKHEDGRWGWLIFEFLKKDNKNLTIEESHPNRYWHMNSRKFLSLWALKESLEMGGFYSALWLVNYDDSREDIKIMIVQDINEESKNKWVCEGKRTKYDEFLVTNDKVMKFDEFKRRFRSFNSGKPGESWEILKYIKDKE